MRRYQEQAQDRLATVARRSSGRVSGQGFPEATDRPETRLGSNGPLPVGRIEIPRIDLSAIVAEGTSSEVLRVPVGHVAGTALPGESGNIALAAHRDTFYRGLGELQSGDLIRLTLPKGRFDCRVDFTEVVSPADTWVLEPGSNQALTLNHLLSISLYWRSTAAFHRSRVSSTRGLKQVEESLTLAVKRSQEELLREKSQAKA